MPNSTNRFTVHFGPARARKLGLLGVTLVALIASGHLLFNARTGVHTIFAAPGVGADTNEWVASPDAPPVVDVQAAKFSQSLTYPGEILQPSGITWDATAQQFLVVTDQAELFAVSADLETLLASTRMSRAPLVARQGSVESVATLENSAVTADRISNVTVPLLSPSGVNSARHKGQQDCPSRDQFESV